jgi:hypothetical protein
MPDSAVTPSTEQEAFVAALPRLRRIQFFGWAAIASMVAVAILILAAVDYDDPDMRTPAMVAIIGAALGSWYVRDQVLKRHGAEVMPIVAATFGLTHDKTGGSFLGIVPFRIPPRSNVNTVDDHLTGTIGGRVWHAAEVRTETGGKSSKVYFDGIVIHVATSGPLPGLMACRIEETQGSFWHGSARINVKDVTPVSLPSNRMPHGFGVWRTDGKWGTADFDPERTAILIDAVSRAASGLAPDSRALQILFDDRAITVATGSGHEMFRIGGLFATRATVMEDIRRVAQEVGPLIRAITDILQAEVAYRA